jgi:hypothetical protein
MRILALALITFSTVALGQVDELIVKANAETDKFRLRNEAVFAGQIKTAEDVITLYSGLGPITFDTKSFDSYFLPLAPTCEQIGRMSRL